MAATLLNTKAALDGNTVMVLETAETITSLKTFDRDPNAPFAVTASSAVVTNLDADLWDGFHSNTYTGASTIVTLGTITTGVWNAGAVTSSGLFTSTVFGIHTLTASAGTGVHALRVGNTASGATNTTYLRITSGSHEVYLESFSQGYTTSGSAVASGARLYIEGAGGLSIQAAHASGVIRFITGGTTRRMLLDTTGIVTMDAYGAGTATFSSAGVISSVSDERLKDDIRPLGYGLAEVMALDPIRHFWTDASGLNDPAHTEYGSFGAASVKAVMPLAVGQDARGYLTLGDRPILGATVNAIKELHARVVTLEARVH